MRDASPASATDSDAALVEHMARYQAGELSAFEALYAALAQDLRRFFAAAVEAQDVGDLIQEAFLEMHRARHTYLPPLPVRPWVFGVARNVLSRHRRAKWRRARRESAALSARAESWRVAPPATLSGCDVADVVEALRAVPKTRRQVWLMHHLHGFSFPEIAARLGIGAGAAKLRSSRATRALRAALGIEQEPFDE